MGKKLYVGNLAYGVSDSALEQLFSQFGTVQSAQVIQDRATGRSKGFGFVEMDNDAQAQAARKDGQYRHNGDPRAIGAQHPHEKIAQRQDQHEVGQPVRARIDPDRRAANIPEAGHGLPP